MGNIIKCRFLRGCEPYGREYSYLTKEPVAVGDVVQVETQLGVADVQVTAVNVPAEEVESFKDKLKYIIGKKSVIEISLLANLKEARKKVSEVELYLGKYSGNEEVVSKLLHIENLIEQARSDIARESEV